MEASSRPRDTHKEPSLPPPARPTPTPTPSSAGTKRPAASLLPPFELSSSPGLPRPTKRPNTGHNDGSTKYPTPIPTSTTGILSSSPLRRPALHRAPTTSERVPLSSVPTLMLPENGEVVTMGRSSNSSSFQLSANRLISRVHVRARYIPAPNALGSNKIEIVCEGWNGLRLHSGGRTEDLHKGDSFTSATEGTEIIVDVQDARVMVQWPKRAGIDALSESSWDDSPRSQRRESNNLLQSSPLRRNTRIASPESPTPRHLTSSQRLQALLPVDSDEEDARGGIQIYEDEPTLPPRFDDEVKVKVDVNASMCTDATASFHSDLGEDDEENDKDPDEENDPIVHSFGPFGANLSGRIASMLSAKSPTGPAVRREPIMKRLQPVPSTETFAPALDLSSLPPSPQKGFIAPRAGSLASSPIIKRSASSDTPLSSPPPMPAVEISSAVSNHVVNQLAFSRLSSTPLSTIMANLPADEKRNLTKDILRRVIEATPSIGTIARSGKDAAGKALESEYYYLPENDDDEQRRLAVVDGLRKPSLRACRKQHKQYYWKRPRTP